MKKARFKIGRWIVVVLLIVFLFNILSFGNVELNKEIILNKGDGFYKFLEQLDWKKRLYVKYYIYSNDVDTSKIAVGTYSFSGSYSVSDFVSKIVSGPEKNFYRTTILEGRSIYDTDDYLNKKGYINKGEYINYVTNISNIKRVSEKYEFLSKVSNIKTLEGFLYPDTYFVDTNGNFVENLVDMQLDAFDKKIWKAYMSDIELFNNKLVLDYSNVSLSFYDIIKLASIVQKEERNKNNQAIVAGIFLNRIENRMRLDADITLCYSLAQPYSVCTPSYISRFVNDEKNIYNTRRKFGLTPTPISNFPNLTFYAILNYKKTDYMYYLHDDNAKIYYGKTLQEHNDNKSRYLR